MTIAYNVRPPADDVEVNALLENHRPIFNVPPDRSESYGKLVGRENFRNIYADDRLVGGLALVPMGQFFGGQSVQMAGIAAVGVDPAVRGKGAATTLMRETIRQLHADGCPLSGLYPATQPLYRYAGYEQAGEWFEVKIPLKPLQMKERALTVRPIGVDDRDTVKAVYRADAQRYTGILDRGDYVWSRIWKSRDGEADGYLFERDGTAEGYILFTRKDGETNFLDFKCTDCVALTPAAGRRILSFLADHRSMTGSVTMNRAPWDPLLALMPEQNYEVRLVMQWMLRIVDVPKALEARGYPRGLAAELHLDVRDDLVNSNNERFVLRVADGRATVDRGGEGKLSIDIRGLAPLYAGHRHASQLMTSDLLTADDDSLAIASSIFAGPHPWMADMF